MINFNRHTYLLEPHNYFSKDLLESDVNVFWSEVVNKLEENQHILVFLQMQYKNDHKIILGLLQRFYINEKDHYILYLNKVFDLDVNTYTSKPVKYLHFYYQIRDDKLDRSSVKFQIYYNNRFPITMNPFDFCHFISKKDNQLIFQLNRNVVIIITQHNDYINYYILVEYYRKGNLVYKWKDSYINENSFRRDLGKSSYFFEDNELTLIKIEKHIKNFNK